jgi:hypothetical protein
LPNGNPLRAKITATFVKYETPVAVAAAARMSSPDLTHQRISKEGDRLDYLTFTIYDNTNYILQVAKANDLTSIRRIKPGLELFFPPINKTDT